MEANHKDCKIKNCGLVVSTVHDCLGASPDRIFSCSCHGKRLVEVKCPYTLVDSTRTIKSMDFLKEDENGCLTLKETGNSYFDQIQGQMGVTGIHQCDLVVYDGKTVEVVPVTFNPQYWEKLAGAVSQFYHEYVYSALKENDISANVSRKKVQSEISAKTDRYPCGKCGVLLEEIVANDAQASINCECTVCNCRLGFHWKCVNFTPDPELDSEPPWYCPNCVRNCDIIM
ncbi:uncharacterized protein LOC128235510 [Mya arenaria]|uniref:uncharacterized protein LOC128235510 n=1 Tax=Mya arenaria TaxID=6604 RepID=UPI0022E53C21|nr:uncharacterized protein LOC128235510 [Mya arenaria]